MSFYIEDRERVVTPLDGALLQLKNEHIFLKEPLVWTGPNGRSCTTHRNMNVKAGTVFMVTSVHLNRSGVIIEVLVDGQSAVLPLSCIYDGRHSLNNKIKRVVERIADIADHP